MPLPRVYWNHRVSGKSRNNLWRFISRGKILSRNNLGLVNDSCLYRFRLGNGSAPLMVKRNDGDRGSVRFRSPRLAVPGGTTDSSRRFNAGQMERTGGIPRGTLELSPDYVWSRLIRWAFLILQFFSILLLSFFVGALTALA